MIRLALLRHGHTAWNRAGRLQGRTDIPLDPEAEEALAQLRLPAEWASAQLWSSPLLRATRTAELVSGRQPKTSPALTEMNWGTWEGRKGVDLIAEPSSGYKHIEDWGWDFRPPGGETPAELRCRLSGWWQKLQSDAVAVCHIGIMRVFLACATGWNFDGQPPFLIKRNRLYVLRIDGVTLTLEDMPVRLEQKPQ